MCFSLGLGILNRYSSFSSSSSSSPSRPPLGSFFPSHFPSGEHRRRDINRSRRQEGFFSLSFLFFFESPDPKLAMMLLLHRHRQRFFFPLLSSLWLCFSSCCCSWERKIVSPDDKQSGCLTGVRKDVWMCLCVRNEHRARERRESGMKERHLSSVTNRY